MAILVTGATGLVGRELVPELCRRGHKVHISSRNIANAQQLFPSCKVHKWPLEVSGDLAEIITIIHLAGESVADGRWTEQRKERLVSSRVDALADMQKICALSGSDLSTCLSASGSGYYGISPIGICVEDSVPGEDFLANLCVKWEETLTSVAPRTVAFRLGVILSSQGGALEKMRLPFSLGLGGKIGSGKQWMSWVHVDDVVGAFLHALENSEISGSYNLVSDMPVTNEFFTKELGKAIYRPTLFPVPACALKWMFGEMSSIMTGGQRVSNEKLRKTGFEFKFKCLRDALKDVI